MPAVLLSVSAFCLLIPVPIFFGAVQVRAQTPPATITFRDEINAFRSLFNRDLAYANLADQAQAAHQPKPHLRRILANRFSFSPEDAASLDRLSIEYGKELASLHATALPIFRAFYARFPGGVIRPGTDKNFPSELTQLQLQDDALVLRYRDLLRNSMREADFQETHDLIMADFASGVALRTNSGRDQ